MAPGETPGEADTTCSQKLTTFAIVQRAACGIQIPRALPTPCTLLEPGPQHGDNLQQDDRQESAKNGAGNDVEGIMDPDGDP